MERKTITIGDRSIELLSSLGKGTYGSVYVTTVGNNRKAIKIITNVGKDGIKSLLEIDIMSRINHPNLVRAEGIIVGIDEIITSPTFNPIQQIQPILPIQPTSPDNIATVGIIMPLATTDLRRLIIQPNFNINMRFKIMYDILKGTKYLHYTGHIHGDLKPMNVLIFGKDNNMMAKITDFGISLIMENGKKYYPVELVTITHRAPEILNNDRNYTTSTDIWSLGIIFLEMLSGGRQIFPDYNKSKVKATIKKLFSIGSIDNTLNSYLSGVNPDIKARSITLIKKMLDFDPTKRPSVDEIMKNPLFQHFRNQEKLNYKKLGKPIGKVIYKRPYPPRKCDSIYYYGYDYMVRLAMKLTIKVETFFLAADIYQRALAYGHHLTGDFKKDWANVALTAATSLYMAIKMIEPYKPDTLTLSKLSSNIFSPNDIIKVEASLVQLFGGIIYSRNLFTDSNGKKRLVYSFDNLLMNCHIYHRIDLDQWIKDGKKNQEVPYNKNILFSQFIGETEYYNNIVNGDRNKYVPLIYNKDVKNISK